MMNRRTTNNVPPSHLIEPIADWLHVYRVMLNVFAGLTNHYNGFGAVRTQRVVANHPYLIQMLDVMYFHWILIS